MAERIIGEREIARAIGAGHVGERTGQHLGEFALTDLFERAAEQGRLHGLRLEGLWMHVGTPGAITAAEIAIRASTG